MYEQLKEILSNHGVFAFPTETVMGLGVFYDDKLAYEKMNKIKNRPEDKPYTLMLKSVDDIEKYAFVSKKAKKIINAFLPGPLTILLPVKDNVPGWVTHNGSVIGVRIPDLELLLDVLKAIEKPILAPSANKSGEKPAMNSDEVKAIFNNELDYIVEGNALGGVPSTIIDLSFDEIKILRQGPINIDMIKSVIGD